ncbi:MAG: ABC transporter permease [Spirochaetota bacterium]|nr:ABC transporter permease [Spirochaetota bacterium]
MKNLVDRFGGNILKLLYSLGEVSLLTYKTIIYSFKKPFSGRNLLDQMVKIGFNSLPVTLATAIAVGMVLALQFGWTLEKKLAGSSQFLGGVVGLSFVRELGPALTSLMVTGRIGSAIAAELGTMKVTEQIDALITLSADPIQYLSVPRLLASILMFPALAMIANIVGIFGGGLVAISRFNQNANVYIDQMATYVDFGDVVTGLIKSSVFGGIMAVISCYQGFKTYGGAVGVGKSTTKAVVISSISIIIADYFLNMFFIIFFKI